MPDPTGTALINIGELAKPAVVLIEKISDAVGGIAKPWQIQRVASAEAKADVIKAEARFQISDMEERALRRMIREEGKHQENIEGITEKSIPLLSDDAKPENVENDWLSKFFDKGRLISDGDMQEIWASMLAGEANNPGTFSKRTVELVSTLDKKDAELFTRFCSFVWAAGSLMPLVFDINNPQPEDDIINFGSIQHLMSIGLITQGLGFMRNKIPKLWTISYYQKFVQLSFPAEHENTMPTGMVLLTTAGAQLATICGSQPNKDFFMRMVNKWSDEGLCPSEPMMETSSKRLESWFE